MKFKQNRRKYDDDDATFNKKESDDHIYIYMNAKRNSTYVRTENVDQIFLAPNHTSLWASRFEYTLTHTHDEAKKKRTKNNMRKEKKKKSQEKKKEKKPNTQQKHQT